MKIKRKVEMNLPQLIEYAWENNVKGKFFPIDQNEEPGIYFATNNDFMMKNADFIRYDNTFTVEVEEAVDSDTVLDNIYTVNVEVGTSHITYYKSKSINDVKTDEINIVYTILQEEAIVLWDSQGGFR